MISDDRCVIIYTVLYTVHNPKYYTYSKEDVLKAYMCNIYFIIYKFVHYENNYRIPRVLIFVSGFKLF